jgi:hypothetical protein
MIKCWNISGQNLPIENALNYLTMSFIALEVAFIFFFLEFSQKK